MKFGLMRLGAFVAAAAALPLLAAAAPPGPPPASVRQLRMETAIEEDGTAVQTLHVETAVANDAAARREAQLPMPFSETVERLVTELRAVLQSPDLKRRLAETGSDIGGTAPAEFARRIATDYENFGKVIRGAGIKPE